MLMKKQAILHTMREKAMRERKEMIKECGKRKKIVCVTIVMSSLIY